MIAVPIQSSRDSSKTKMDQGASSTNPAAHRHLVQSPYYIPVFPPLHDRAPDQQQPHREPPFSPGRSLPQSPKSPDWRDPQSLYSPGRSLPASPYSPSRPLPVSPHAATRPLPEPYQPPQSTAGKTLSPPLPVRGWPYVLPTDPSQAQGFPVPAWADHEPLAVNDTAGNTYRSGSVTNSDRERKTSDGTTISSTTGDEQDKENKRGKKKSSSKISGKVKSAVKDMFTRENKAEPPVRRKQVSDPWFDEDY